MASLNEVPLVELVDIFDEEEFVGPPEQALLARPKTLQRTPRTPTSTTVTTDQPPGHVVPYTPLHPANQKSPTRRGRPPKNAFSGQMNPVYWQAPAHPPPAAIIVPRTPQTRTRSNATRFVQQPTSLSPIEQPWAPPTTRFGGMPNFHTALGNGAQPPPMRPQGSAPMPQYMLPTTSALPPMTNYHPRIPNILSSNISVTHGPGYKTFKAPSSRAAIRAPVPPPAHAQQPAQFPTLGSDFNINNLLQRVLSGQPILAPDHHVDQNAVSEIHRQLIEDSLKSFNNLNNIPSLVDTLPDLKQIAPEHLNRFVPEQKKIPTEDDIAKQDNEAEADQDEEYHEGETYTDYVPKKLKIGLPHPDPVVETSSLVSVDPPDITYNLQLPNNIIKTCLISRIQLESITYAEQQHQQFLADGRTRRGFLIGDGAGVGKGRTIAGIIYENFLNGRRKSVWLSVSPDLKLDAERDLRDIGAKHIPIHSITKHGYGKRIDAGYGVIFSTYTGLVSKSQSVKGPLGTRLGQLVTWLGPNFDGVIVFDECHKAKNISVTAKKKQSKTADFALDLQNKLPGARIVYASATGASETRHLGYMTRLGLWGEGTPYSQFSDFCSAIERRGVGAMELVAIELKMRGSYVARQLSFKSCSFDIKIANLSEDFVKLYDRCVELWSLALQRFTEACDFFSSDRKQTRRIWTCFWAAHQKFFKYLCIGAKVPLVVQIAKTALEDGKCVVIGLQSTGEAKTLEALEDGDINEFISTARATFESLVENHFPAPPRPRAEIVPHHRPDEEERDTLESSTDASSGTVIDETFHNHEAMKFCAENGLATAELEEDKAAREFTSLEREKFKRRKILLEQLAKESTAKSGRSLRAKKRAKARNVRPTRIQKPIDDSETEASTPTSSSNATDETYSETEDAESESTVKNSAEDDDDDDDSSPVRAKKSRNSPTTKAEMLNSDSDSDIEITAVKPRQRNCEVIILSSDDDEEEDDEALPEGLEDPMKVHGEKLAAMRDELYKMIDEIGPSLPHNTLDDLIDQLGGPDRVAEMTGRKGRVVKDEDGLVSYKQRNEADALDCMNIAEKERFMKGQKLVAIISEAASSGISLQADRRAGNKFRRVHITIELPWSADRAIQQFGRTHRSNQVSGPEYVFVISELAGEKRFASIVAKRLESLGALTHGDRTATTKTRDLSQFNISSRFCRHAIEQIVKYLDYGQNEMHIRPNYNGSFLADARQALLDSGLAKKNYGDRITIEPTIMNVNHFLNRLLGMKVRIQNSLFKLFTDYMDKLIARKKVAGQYDHGILELNAEFDKTTCFPPEDYLLRTRAGVVKCTLRNIQNERGLSWEEVKQIYELGTADGKDERSGFYIYPGPGNSQFVTLLMREPDSVDLFRAYRPNTGRMKKPSLFGLLRKGTQYPANQKVERLWQKIYTSSATLCQHLLFGDSCKRREAKMTCEIGLRHKNYCILSGGILTAWPYLERKSSEITEKVTLIRLQIDANTRVIGPMIPQQYVHRVRQILSEDAISSCSINMTPARVYSALRFFKNIYTG